MGGTREARGHGLRRGLLSGFIAAIVFASLAALLAPHSAYAIGASDAIAHVNALRGAHGIPGDLIEDGALSAGCRAHVRYAVVNGGFDSNAPHQEIASQPGYSPEGELAGQSSVLGSGSGWTDPNPWYEAPYHLRQVLNPWLMQTGYAEERGYVCLQTQAGPNRALPRHSIYTFPGAGSSGVPPSETASENDGTGRPRVPGDAVGLPGGTTTGPYIIVMAHDPRKELKPRLESASLVGPSGAVDIAVADDAFVIPRKPLARHTQYTARVSIRYSGEECRTQGSPPPLPGVIEIPVCGPDIPSYCIAPSVLPPGAPAPPPDPSRPRTCNPGEQPYEILHPLPDEVVTHQWSFTTGVPLPGRLRRTKALGITSLRVFGRRSLRRDRGRLRVRVRITSPATLRITVRNKRGRLYGTGTRRARTGGGFGINVKLHKRALRKRLAHHRRIPLIVHVRAVGAAGTTAQGSVARRSAHVRLRR